MKKTILSVLSLALCFSLSAQDEVARYFFAPEGLGDADGSSWENAAGGEYLGQTIANAEPGTEFYLMEGNYLPDATTNYWDIPEGIVIKGGYPTSMTGTDTNNNWMKGGQSVFSADLDGDGLGDNNDYAFVYFGRSDFGSKDNYYYSGWQLTEIWGITFRDGNRTGGRYEGNMVFMKHAKADFHYCRFINNVAHGVENGALMCWGSQLRCFDCIFRKNNTAVGGGSSFILRARNCSSSASEITEADREFGYFERCEFEDNISCEIKEGTEEWGNYGGGMGLGDNAGTCYIINSTIKGSRAWNRGGGIRVSGNCSSFFISNTFVDNICVNTNGENGGEAISAGDNTYNYFVNNIIVNSAADDTYNTNRAVIHLTNNDSRGISEGYNVIGTMVDVGSSTSTWPATDKLSSSASNVNTIESVFGTLKNKFKDNGGVSKTIAPTADVSSITIEGLQEAVAKWPIEEAAKVMDLTKDQRGYTRAATTMSGAYDANATQPEVVEGLENINSWKVMNDGVYTILGQYIGSEIEDLPAGMYIQSGKKVIVK